MPPSIPLEVRWAKRGSDPGRQLSRCSQSLSRRRGQELSDEALFVRCELSQVEVGEAASSGGKGNVVDGVEAVEEHRRHEGGPQSVLLAVVGEPGPVELGPWIAGSPGLDPCFGAAG